MTPGARIAAAIDVLADMASGVAAEQALTRWARRSRFAGSKDRAAIRDHVFDVLRCRNSAAYFGQGNAPRQLMIGLLHQQGADLDQLFSGQGYAPAPLEGSEANFPPASANTSVQWNLPEWLVAHFEESLGEAAADAAQALQQRAPVFLRVNTLKANSFDAQAALENEGIVTQENPLSDTALTVLEGSRKIRQSNAFLKGWVELQDAASQAVVATLPPGGKTLDYCAGGGGKALALAADTDRNVFAHDIDPRRMSDIKDRAARAGARITQIDTSELTSQPTFQTVLCDAPCSGSGAWRRAAEGKWSLTPEKLSELTRLQDEILGKASGLVMPNGVLAYATCSVFRTENEDRVAAFLATNPGWHCTFQRRFSINSDGDGFFTAHLMRDS